MSSSARPADGGHVLILVQNLPVPLDRRVWLECQTLVRAGYRVSVDLPEGAGRSGRAGARRRAHHEVRPAARGPGLAGFVVECVMSWVPAYRLARRL